MALYIPVPNTLQANIRFTCAGQRCENVINFDYTGPGFNDACIAVVDAINTVLWPPLRGALSTGLSMVEIYMVDLASESGETRTGTPATPSNGSRSSNPAPLSVTLCVSYRTAQRGRSYRGRSYVVGLAADAINNQNIDEAIAGGVLASFIALRNAAAAADVPMVVVSRRHNNLPRVTGIATPITSVVLNDTVVDSQRRRLPGRGT